MPPPTHRALRAAAALFAPGPPPARRGARAAGALGSPFIAVDVETTGFSPSRDRILEVAWVRFEGGRAIGGASALCRVDGPIPAEIQALTGISPSMVRRAAPFLQTAPRLLSALRAASFVVAYNAPFDIAFLRAELARGGLVLPAVPVVDPLRLVREREPRATSHRLAAVCARHGVRLQSAHRALDDARAAGEIFVRMGG